MMKHAVFLCLFNVLSVSWAFGGNVGANINIRIGDPPPVVVAPAPVPVIVSEPPLFLTPSSLGFAVAVGVPYDMFYIDGRYYLHQSNVWYAGHRYDGPWTVVVRDRLPPGLRKHKHEKIILVRDEEYHHYRKNRDRYRGKTYRPERYDDRGEKRGHGKKGRGRGHDD